jgi:hypothetical protein
MSFEYKVRHKIVYRDNHEVCAGLRTVWTIQRRLYEGMSPLS